MKNLAFTSLAAFGALALPVAAHAQSNSTPKVETFVGASVGIHDLGLDVPNDDSGIYGAVAGVDLSIGKTFFVGAEGNFHFGDGAVNHEYGVAARAGVRFGDRGKLFVRGGFQEVELNMRRLTGLTPPAGLDTSDGDYLVGAGVEFPLGDSPVAFRAGIDTIAFDSTRATAGLLFKF